MNWFYAEGSQQKGPVSDMELTRLAEQGQVKPGTLLWREGLPDWQPMSRVRPDLAQTTGAPVIGGMAIPEESKDLLVQQMREGVLVEASLPGAVPYVGFWWRLLAWKIDFLIVTTVGCILTIPLSMMFNIAGMGVSDPYGMSAAQIIVQVVSTLIGYAVQGFYATWMTGKYGATLGKQALGFKVITEDGNKPTYLRSFARWAAFDILGDVIFMIVLAVPVFVVVMLGMSFSDSSMLFEPNNEGMLFVWVIGIMGAALVGSFVGLFPCWMAAFDSEKRTLHDRICATRVVRK